MSFRIPSKRRDEFIGWMDAYNNMAEGMPDGAWFATLEDVAQEFMTKYNIHWGDGNDGAHYYLELKSKEKGEV